MTLATHQHYPVSSFFGNRTFFPPIFVDFSSSDFFPPDFLSGIRLSPWNLLKQKKQILKQSRFRCTYDFRFPNRRLSTDDCCGACAHIAHRNYYFESENTPARPKTTIIHDRICISGIYSTVLKSRPLPVRFSVYTHRVNLCARRPT